MAEGTPRRDPETQRDSGRQRVEKLWDVPRVTQPRSTTQNHDNTLNPTTIDPTPPLPSQKWPIPQSGEPYRSTVPIPRSVFSLLEFCRTSILNPSDMAVPRRKNHPHTHLGVQLLEGTLLRSNRSVGHDTRHHSCKLAHLPCGRFVSLPPVI